MNIPRTTGQRTIGPETTGLRATGPQTPDHGPQGTAESGFTRHSSLVTRHPPSLLAFTMIEIAICLAVIGFALAAIVGVLPLGMNVQRENREETVIDKDASVFIDAMRNGQLGLDDLTNYVVAITNYETDYTLAGKPVPHVFGYTYKTSSQGGSPMTPTYPITNGFRIVGLLSTPRYTETAVVPGNRTIFHSNYVVAYVRSLSGDASEKFPQTNAVMNDLAFTYRMVSDIVPYSDFDRAWTNYSDPLIVGNTNEINARSNYWMVVKTVQTNLYDLRLIFRYPYLPNGRTGNGRLVYRTSASGRLLSTNEFGFPLSTPYRLYYFEPRTYVKAL